MRFNDQIPTAVVDIGNTSLKVGLFAAGDHGASPRTLRCLDLDARRPGFDSLAAWLGGVDANWCLISVQRRVESELIEWLEAHQRGAFRCTLQSQDLPIEIDVERPDSVGMDRLAAAVAANDIREPNRPAIVIDAGTALTVDLVGPGGVFLGGAIAPGAALAASALHEATDLLPLVELWKDGEPPPPRGRSTEQAIRSGLFWGGVGTARELAHRLAKPFEQPAQIFVTGGGGELLAEFLGTQAEFREDLVLAGGMISLHRLVHERGWRS